MGLLHLPAQPRGLRVVPLTRELAMRLKAKAALALNGDGTCSLRSMTTSCFASENCANGHSALHLDMLLMQPHVYVAVTDLDPDGATRLDEDTFVGCVSASHSSSIGQRLFPETVIQSPDLMLSNLCVAEAYRKHGIGRRLVETIVNLRAPNTYLLIARKGERSDDPHVRSAFRDRVARLRSTYARLGFEQRCQCDDAALMCHHRK